MLVLQVADHQNRGGARPVRGETGGDRGAGEAARPPRHPVAGPPSLPRLTAESPRFSAWKLAVICVKLKNYPDDKGSRGPGPIDNGHLRRGGLKHRRNLTR